jgi:hypothetical protein
MPYIKQEDRKKFDDVLKNLPVPANAGELNYLFTKIAINYFKFKEPPNQNYQTINDIAGAFYGAAAEFTRRITESYENDKIANNGDVY